MTYFIIPKFHFPLNQNTRLPQLKTVIIDVSYFSFYVSNAAASKEILRTNMYTAIPSWSYIESRNIDNLLLGKFNRYIGLPFKNIIRTDNWKGVFAALFAGYTQDPEITVKCNYKEPHTLDQEARQAAQKHITGSARNVADYPELGEDAYQALSKGIQYLKTRHIRIILFTPPYPQIYTETFVAEAPATIDYTQEKIRTLQEQYGVEYYDFSADPRFITDYKYFRDGDHLNECGAKRFTVTLEQAINSKTSVTVR